MATDSSGIILYASIRALPHRYSGFGSFGSDLLGIDGKLPITEIERIHSCRYDRSCSAILRCR